MINICSDVTFYLLFKNNSRFFETSYKFQLNEGKSAYKMIRMQLQELPLLLAGALGAAITGMVAPGLSFLFGEIQKVTHLSIVLALIKVEFSLPSENTLLSR